MALIIFYEKPGCRNQTRQKEVLRTAGHELDVRDLLSTPWRAETLRPFFQNLPVAEWFNRAAPRIKSGGIDPAALTPDEAIEAMLADPLLIRRPLAVVGEHALCGIEQVHKILWISNELEEYPMPQLGDLETCVRTKPCPPDNRAQRSDQSVDPLSECVSAWTSTHKRGNPS
jgi:nitrogenase-associated protein